MKLIKITVISLATLLISLTLSGCENTHVSGSISYGMGIGGGYPMYYGSGYPRHSNVVVVKPPRQARPRPNRPSTRPARVGRR
ncbi:hypothetical protein KO495_00595 [Colwellia sp. D2M02]|uniref:Lipoprotein n=1 Tax=Colwellia asteriadis TaxID=517723 RepID=A0ABN1L3R3_9GAMM|nr:hypothetical protein [Colwellia sp. D2M02]MBU2891815.1 hypothetical protein [Colwellia sp. D2M02]